MTLTVNMDRLRSDLETLGRIGRVESGGISRASFSELDWEAREWYRQLCVEAGLRVRIDGLGNMFAGMEPHLLDSTPSVWTGSHIDTVPEGGMLDGALGCVAALECIRRLKEEKLRLHRPIFAVVFSDEEGNYAPLLGSTGIAAGYDQQQLESMRGRNGDRLIETLTTRGFDLNNMTGTRVDPQDVHAFVELHIEQGPYLEQRGTDIGVVTSIMGIGGGTVEFLGRADHAGTTPMDSRRDALRAAAHFLVVLPEVVASISPASVATCGFIEVTPGAANVVPSLARLTLDFRDPDTERFNALADEIVKSATLTATQHGVSLAWNPRAAVQPVQLDENVQKIITGAALELGLSTMRMPSGAGHDSQNMVSLAPTGLIFVPSAGGRSHSPDEYTSWEDIEKGANVLLATVITLASS